MGPIEKQWLREDVKVEILGLVTQAKCKGTPVVRSCEMLAIQRRRVNRWRKKQRDGHGLGNIKPGPRQTLHRLRPAERDTVLSMAKKEQYADLSHRILAVTAWDLEIFFVSFSSVYRILRADGLMAMRGAQRSHNGRSTAPVRKELTGPNQRWCWDISYLRTMEKGVFLYLYLLLDEYSRKAIQWLVSWSQCAQEAQRLLEGGLMTENILDLPEEERPEVINDRGRQMKAKPIKRLFEDHHMPQLFARPRTPNDNPFVESAFGTAKRAPSYPERFLDRVHGVDYFDGYFQWYNNDHFHSGIDYVTPEQCHQGLREVVVAERRRKIHQWRRWRKEVNRTERERLTREEESGMLTVNQPATCSVINL